MRRYIVFSIGPEEGGRIEGSVDNLDDIFGDDVEIVDTMSGTHLFWHDGEWSPAGHIDDIEIINVQRKGDPPPRHLDYTEEMGGYLIPKQFRDAIYGSFDR